MFSKSLSGICTYENIQGVTKKVVIPQRNAVRANINNVCLVFVNIIIKVKKEERSVANKKGGEKQND